MTVYTNDAVFRAIFNSTFQFIGLLSPDGTLLEANQTALDFGNLTLSDVVGKPFWECFWWTISPQTQQQLREAITQAAQGTFVRYEVEVLGAAGRIVTIDFSLKPLFDSNGQVMLLLPEGRDITDRKKAEALRRTTEELLAGILTCSLDGIVALRALRDSSGAIVDFLWVLVNPKAEEVLKRSASELIGQTLLHTLPGNRDLGLFDSYVRVVETGMPASHEFFYNADGLQGWYQNTATKLGDGFTLTFRDITQQKQAEEIRLAMSVAQMGTWEMDLATRQVTRSSSFDRMFGLPPDGSLRTTEDYFARVYPNDLALIYTVIDSMIQTGSDYYLEYRVIHPDGNIVWVAARGTLAHSATGEPARLVGTLIDITERKRAEERNQKIQEVTAALARTLTQREMVDLIIEHATTMLRAPAVLVGLMSNDGSLVEMVGQYGYPPPIAERFNSIPINGVAPLLDAIRTREPLWLSAKDLLTRYPNLSEDQQPTGGSSICLPLIVGETVIGGLMITFHDDRKLDSGERSFLETLGGLYAQALERAQLYEAEHAARTTAEEALRLREHFLSIASHELKTPLTALKGNAELFARRAMRAGTLSERDQRTLNIIIEQAGRLDRLIMAMLDVSQLQIGQLQLQRTTCNLVALSEQALRELQAALVGHPVTLHAAGEPLLVMGDPLRLGQVIHNLLQNAIKYSSEHGRIEIHISRVGDEAFLAVRDEGIGIPANALPQIFGRFYRAPNTDTLRISSGMGIGLYVVREIIAQHGGQISVESTEGQGSTFTVRLPLVLG